MLITLIPLLISIPAPQAPAPPLPVRVNVRLVRALEWELTRIEEEAALAPGMDKTMVRNVTLPLQNYLEDVVLASGKYADIYPQAIYEVVLEKARSGLERKELGKLILRYHKEGLFEKMARGPERREG